MPSSNLKRTENSSAVYDARRTCGFCSVIYRLFSARPCNRQRDTLYIDRFVKISAITFVLLMIINIFAATAIAKRTLLASETHKQAQEIQKLLALSLKELTQLKIDG